MIVISRASLTRITEVIDEEIDIKDNTSDNNLTVEDGSVVFKNVNFSIARIRTI